MSVRNKIAVYIDGINYTKYSVMPFKYGDFLDERLDEAYITIKGIKRAVIPPLTLVQIDITNTIKEAGHEKNVTKQYVVASDSVEETQLGSGIYTHTLYIIELTKIAECVICDTLTFTNDLGRTYTNDDRYAEPVWD